MMSRPPKSHLFKIYKVIRQREILKCAEENYVFLFILWFAKVYVAVNYYLDLSEKL